MYQVQFKTSGIVAFSSTDRAIAAYWLELNDYAPEVPVYDPDTKEIIGWERGENLGLFKLVKVRSTDGACAKVKGE
jgi:hypothetical protein